MIKIYITLAIVLGLGLFMAGYFVADGRCAKHEVKAISDQVKEKNKDQLEITEKITEVRTSEGESIEKIHKVKTIYINNNECPVIKLNIMQQSIYKAFK